MSSRTHHAGCVIIGTFGILIRGASGSGKSALADAMLETARRNGNFTALVSDDRTILEVREGALIASAPEQIRGLVEIRGVGICGRRTEPEARVALVLDLVPPSDVERMPENLPDPVLLEGVKVPRVKIPERQCHASIGIARWALRGLFPNAPDYI
ncbi:HPr kinase/phosphorylase [Roseibium sp.]|uniref:HPr kinase/phosphorylase n=1 Tax=Roseibium sp. TaxID=1936156 RepID=UPI003A9766D0